MAEVDDEVAELLPLDDDGIDVDDELEAAAASALGGLDEEPEPEEAPEPFGRSWLWDPDRRRFVRHGQAPAEARGLDAARMWAFMAVHTARFAHAVFSDAFGMDRPEEPIGRTDTVELEDDYAERVRDALLIYDRFTDVEVECHVELDGSLVLDRVDIVTDEEEPIKLRNVTIRPETFANG